MKKRKRKKALNQAEAMCLHQLYLDLNHPKILKIGMHQNVFNAVAYVDMERHVPVEYLKEELARNLVRAVINADLVKLDVVDDINTRSKMIKGSISVVVPKETSYETPLQRMWQ